MSSPKAAICVTFQIKPENFQDFLTAVKIQASNSLTKESWCHQFDVCVSPNRPNTVLLYETYDDEASTVKHRQTEHFEEFNTKIANWVEFKDVHIWKIEN
jgi:quinol monooxygenase YgiN